MLERYTLVKGGTDLLDPDTRKPFVGLRETPVGFEGLSDDPKRVYALFGDRVIYEKPTLEDIMVYTIKFGENRGGNQGAEHSL